MAATLMMLVAKDIRLRKQQIKSKMRKAKRKQRTAAIIVPVLPADVADTGLAGVMMR